MDKESKAYEITNTTSGQSLGLYLGATSEEAIMAMLRDAGGRVFSPEDINSAGILADARSQGYQEVVELAAGSTGPGPDVSITVYLAGGELVAVTNGDPVWECVDGEAFIDLMIEAGIEPDDLKLSHDLTVRELDGIPMLAGPEGGEYLSTERATCDICGRKGWRADWPEGDSEDVLVADPRRGGKPTCGDCAGAREREEEAHFHRLMDDEEADRLRELEDDEDEDD